jgi:glycosyltransferase involved in cell wall biosynthesis
MKLSVLIPAYNEEQTIEQIIRRVAAVALPVDLEILVHDDASTDGTAAILAALCREMPQLRVIRRARNGGKGVGVRTLIRAASGDMCIFQDADEEYDPADYRRLIEVYRAGGWPAVYGYRNLAGQPLVGQIGNHGLTVLTDILYGCWLKDMETCYKLLDARLLRTFDLHANGYDIEPEITINLRKRGYRITQVPIGYHPRPTPSKKLRRMTDGWLALRMILRHRLPGAPAMPSVPIRPPVEEARV